MVNIVVDHGQRDEDGENSDQREGHGRVGHEAVGLLSSVGLEHVGVLSSFFQNNKKSLP
jgi:hypothetical protein